MTDPNEEEDGGPPLGGPLGDQPGKAVPAAKAAAAPAARAAAAASEDEIPAALRAAGPAMPANPFGVALVTDGGGDVWSKGLTKRFNRLHALNLAAWLLAVTGARRSEYEPVVGQIRANLPVPAAKGKPPGRGDSK